jgi:glycosyltransferase involved in cell wall biosynthesis
MAGVLETVTEVRRSYAFVLPWSIEHEGGVNEVVRNLIEEFRVAKEFHPLLIENDWATATPVVERRAHYTHIRMRLRGLSNASARVPLAFLLSLPFTLRTLWRLAREHRIVAFNLHFPSLDSLNCIALRAFRLFPGKVILSFHGSDIRGAHQLHGWVRLAYRYLLRQADAVVSCSAGLKSEILALEPRARTSIIYNGIDEDRFRALTGPMILPTHLRRKELVLSIGKYQFGKAHDLLLQAFARVLEKRPSAHLVIVGATGPELEKTRATVVDSGLTQSVTLYQDLPHSVIPGMLSSAQVFVLASRWVPGKLGEGFPVALLEAGMAGRPVVTTRTCGAEEIIEDGVTGRVVDLEDACALAQAICELLEDKERAAVLAANLRRRVLEQFTWSRAYQSYATLCRARPS